MLRILQSDTFDTHERRHNKALHRTAIPLRSIAAGELGRSPFASLRENAGLSRCPFPPPRYGRTRGTKPTASQRLSPALYERRKDARIPKPVYCLLTLRGLFSPLWSESSWFRTGLCR